MKKRKKGESFNDGHLGQPAHGMMMSDQTGVNDDGNKDHQVGDTSCRGGEGRREWG